MGTPTCCIALLDARALCCPSLPLRSANSTAHSRLHPCGSLPGLPSFPGDQGCGPEAALYVALTYLVCWCLCCFADACSPRLHYNKSQRPNVWLQQSEWPCRASCGGFVCCVYGCSCPLRPSPLCVCVCWAWLGQDRHILGGAH